MKRPADNLSPMQLAFLELLGTLIAAAYFVLPLPEHFHRTFGSITALLVPLLGGLGLSIWAFLRLKNGVQKNNWPEAALAPLRRITQSPYFTAFGFVLLAGFLAFNLLDRQYRHLGWAAYLLGMFVVNLKGATRPPTINTTTAPRLDWHTRPPLQSDQWGQR